MTKFKKVLTGLAVALAVVVVSYVCWWKIPIVGEREIQDSDPRCTYVEMSANYDLPIFNNSLVINLKGNPDVNTSDFTRGIVYIAYAVRHKRFDKVILAGNGLKRLTLPMDVFREIGKNSKYSDADIFEIQYGLAEHSKDLDGKWIQKDPEALITFWETSNPTGLNWRKEMEDGEYRIKYEAGAVFWNFLLPIEIYMDESQITK